MIFCVTIVRMLLSSPRRVAKVSRDAPTTSRYVATVSGGIVIVALTHLSAAASAEKRSSSVIPASSRSYATSRALHSSSRVVKRLTSLSTTSNTDANQSCLKSRMNPHPESPRPNDEARSSNAAKLVSLLSRPARIFASRVVCAACVSTDGITCNGSRASRNVTRSSRKSVSAICTLVIRAGLT